MQDSFGLEGSKPNYADMYQYIFDNLKEKMHPDQAYWFEQAAQINRYLNDYP